MLHIWPYVIQNTPMDHLAIRTTIFSIGITKAPAAQPADALNGFLKDISQYAAHLTGPLHYVKQMEYREYDISLQTATYQLRFEHGTLLIELSCLTPRELWEISQLHWASTSSRLAIAS